MEGRSRYTDEWLDDKFVWFANEVQRLWRTVNDLPTKQVEMENELHAVREDAKLCKDGVSALQAAIEKREEERKAEREQARKEKRADRTLIITTAIGCGGLIVAAIQVLSAGHP